MIDQTPLHDLEQALAGGLAELANRCASAVEDADPSTWPDERAVDAQRLLRDAGALLMQLVDPSIRRRVLKAASAIIGFSPSVQQDADCLARWGAGEWALALDSIYHAGVSDVETVNKLIAATDPDDRLSLSQEVGHG